MTDQEVLHVLKNFDHILHLSNFWMEGIRTLGWYLIQALVNLMNLMESVVDKIYTVNGFFNCDQVVAFMHSFQPVLWILFAISLGLLGYQRMFNRKHDGSQIPTALITSMIILVCLPTIMVKLNDLTMSAVNAIHDPGKETMAEEIVKDNITDVMLFDQNRWKSTTLAIPNQVPKENILQLNINEKMDPKYLSDNGQKILGSKIGIDQNGSLELQPLDNGVFTFFKESYYRWNWNFWTILSTLLVTTATLLFLAIKMGRLIFELGVHLILAKILAVTDITTGQKLKQAIQAIFSTFAVMVAMAVLTKLYILFTAWCGNNLGIVKLFLLMGASALVLDGPNIIERLFGIDAGLQSGMKTALAMYAGTRAAIGFGKQSKEMAGKVAGVGAFTMGAGVGAIAGLSEGYSNPKTNPPSLKEERAQSGKADWNQGGPHRKHSTQNSQSTTQSVSSSVHKEGTRSKPEEIKASQDTSNKMITQEHVSSIQTDGGGQTKAHASIPQESIGTLKRPTGEVGHQQNPPSLHDSIRNTQMDDGPPGMNVQSRPDPLSSSVGLDGASDALLHAENTNEAKNQSGKNSLQPPSSQSQADSKQLPKTQVPSNSKAPTLGQYLGQQIGQQTLVQQARKGYDLSRNSMRNIRNKSQAKSRQKGD